MSIYNKYETVVGLEIHAQLKTNSKIFAPDSAAFGAAPNEHTSYITLGHPGTLPVLNKKAVEFATKMGLATNCTIQQYNQFDRKNYFYADLPKGYQVSQFYRPICQNGYIDIEVKEATKRIRIHQIHLEEDAGKSTHDQDPNYSLIDLNRAGVPLIEIVSEPDLRSSEEAYEYLANIRQLVQYLEICDGNMEEGSMRCDANVSVRLKGETKLGQRTEVKNMNSLRNVKRAIEFEAKRQIELIEKGGKVMQQTRSFDAVNGTTFVLRSKEMEHDYRYFPEPDLPPVIITNEQLNALQSALPTLPQELVKRFTEELGLSVYDAKVITDEKSFAQYFEDLIACTKNYKAAANWMIGSIKSYLNEQNKSIIDFPIHPKQIATVIELIDANVISNSAATQKLFPALLETPDVSVADLVKSLNLGMQSDDDLVNRLIEEIMAKFPDKVKAYNNGRKGLIGFFVGQIKRTAKVELDFKLVNKLLINKLSNG